MKAKTARINKLWVIQERAEGYPDFVLTGRHAGGPMVFASRGSALANLSRLRRVTAGAWPKVEYRVVSVEVPAT